MPQAIEDARDNALRNGLTNVQFICAPAEQELPRIVEQGLRPDLVVLDPPRKGCDEALVRAVIDSGVGRIVYVSCNPATLARDCKLFAAAGYGLEAAQPVDMFPMCSHVETVCLLSKPHIGHDTEGLAVAAL